MIERTGASEVEVRFVLRIGGRPTPLHARVPDRVSPVSALLSAVRTIADSVVAQAIRDVAARGLSVSCRAGCGACCRQPVPIAQSEAFALVSLIRSWPAARRQRVEARFRDALTALEAAGLLARLRALDEIDDDDERQAIGREYFALGLACPFLEEESCSIHSDRPIACREYLVTSTAAECADPGPDRIDLVPVPIRPSVALFRMTSEGMGERSLPLLLVLALEWVSRASDGEAASTPGPQLLERFVRGFAGSRES